MQLGIIGLGRMGGNMARRLVRGGHACVVYNRSKGPVEELVKDGAQGTTDLAAFVSMLEAPRAIWLMVPAAVVDRVLPGRHRTREEARRVRAPLRRLRDQWRGLGPGARLLPDDRRRAGDG